MSVTVDISWDTRGLAGLRPGPLSRAIKRALGKAGSTALRDMRSEASKRVRQRKRIKASVVREALRMRRPKRVTIDGSEWAVDVSGKPVPLAAYPHRQTRKGVVVEVNRGKRTLVRSAFVASMGSGHRGVWVRKEKARLPIRELLGSRPVDALLHDGEAEAVSLRGRRAFDATFQRVLPLEIAKGQAG